MTLFLVGFTLGILMRYWLDGTWAERFYLVIKRRGLLAKFFARLYFIMLRPKWMARLWARGGRERSTRMYDEQLGDLL